VGINRESYIEGERGREGAGLNYFGGGTLNY